MTNQPTMADRKPHRFAIEVEHGLGFHRLRLIECPGVDVGGCTEYDPADGQLHPERGCVLESWVDNGLDIPETLTFGFDGVLGWHDDEAPYIETIEPKGSTP